MRYIDDVKEIKNKIYIYGAGMVARLLYNYLIGRNVEIIAFVVTECSTKRGYIYKVPLISSNEIRKDYPVVIATLSNVHREIENVLVSHGISDYLAVSETLIEIMRSDIVPYRNEFASVKLRMSEMDRLYARNEADYLIVSDSKIVLECNVQAITSKEFLESYRKTKTVYILLIKWKKDWKDTINKAFDVTENLVLSFRYKYLNIEDYSLLNRAKEKGFQLSKSNRFYRDGREYFMEDILLYFEKRRPQTLERDALCEGCGLCELNCPVHAVRLVENEYGYRKPKIDTEICINCRKCINECPPYITWNGKTIPKVFAYMGVDRIREHSSSGGIFGTIAECILANSGFVCGAAWGEEFSVGHIMIENEDELYKLQMSKYIRSDIRAVIPRIKEALIKQREVLFVGCPCQVAAVKEFIGNDKNLFTMDLICSEAPSHWIFIQYLIENYDITKIKEIGFRGKEDGWRPDSIFIKDITGKKIIKHIEDISQKAFHSRMMMDIACEHCNFVKFPRIGDISIGDAWGIPEYDTTLDDKKGTSIVIINNKKGERLYQIASRYAKRTREIPVEWTYRNRTINCIYPHVGRDRFYREIKNFGFNKAFEDVNKDQYDIGLVGNWSYPNYGSELTYFALYHILKDLGYSVLMIEWAEDSYWKPYGCTQLFEIEPYANDEIAQPSRNHYEMRRYNDKCRMFVLGSDQLLNPNLYHGLGEFATLDWVDLDKKKVGYSLSIGTTDVEYTSYDKKEIAYYLNKFDAVSVREKTAVTQMKNLFGVKADWVLDPVFLCKRTWYEKMTKKDCRHKKTGLFAYILDLNEEIRSFIMKVAEEIGETVHMFTDAVEMMTEDRRIEFGVLSEISAEKWLGEMINSRFVIADSFHGICFAIIFRKDFIALRNNYRGGTRFDSILGLLGLEDRLIGNINDLFKADLLNKKIDFEKVERKLEVEKEKSLAWLKNALEKEHQKKYSDDEMFLVERLKRFEKRVFERMEQ